MRFVLPVALLLAAAATAATTTTASAVDYERLGCRVVVERSPGHFRIHRGSCPYAIQLPRRYVLSPAQNFDAWRLGSPGGIRRFTTGCGGDYYWDGSACRRWTVAEDGKPLPPLPR